MKKYFFAFAAVCCALGICGCAGVSTKQIPVVSSFRINSYLGVWYEQARLPNSFEEGLINTQATYRWGRNGQIEVINEGIEEKSGKKRISCGVAEMFKNSTSGELRISFFRPFYAEYRIIYLDENYSQAIVCGSSAEYLWLLSRERKLDEKELQKLVLLAAEYGFDTDSLIYPQK